MVKKVFGFSALLLLLVVLSTNAQTSSLKTVTSSQPKLVVGLVIDQMRWDYLYRYNSLYGTGGFKRLLQEGHSCENTMIPYMPTYTAPGHTCVYTGSVPAVHGIIGNNWYSKKTNTGMYCTQDDSVNTVGSTGNAGKMSPRNLWATTVTDELRLSNNFQSKVIGIALKDRGAILPAGHSANAAYWYDDVAGAWITSTHYMTALPAWVAAFNAKQYPESFMQKDWNTLLPIGKYTLSSADDEPYEATIGGEKSPVFPHELSKVTKSRNSVFKTTPFANTYTFDFAKATIENEQLGKNAITDFLTVSISSTDYIGHTFGPNSIEAEDTYLRLDQDIAGFLAYLDKTVGKGNYLFFLTADHGAAHVPGFLKEHGIPGGTSSDDEILKKLNAVVADKLGIAKAVTTVMNYQVYVSEAATEKKEDITKLVISELKKEDFIADAVALDAVASSSLPEPEKTRMINGYSPSRSGDVQFIFKPGYFDGGSKGTTHGLWNPYDSHIPLLFFGWKVQPGKTYRETYMTDIAATVAAMLHIQMPSGCVGKVIPEVIK